MAKATDELFNAACQAYERYVGNLSEFVRSMVDLGVQVKNVEPFANFAEVIVTHELGGEIQPPATKGYDLLNDDGTKIQVKSLRVSSEKPDANGLDWRYCTLTYTTGEDGKPVWGDRIDAHRLAVVVFYDFRPYALIDFPIVSFGKFPGVDYYGLGYKHVKRLVEGKIKTAGIPMQIIDLQERFKLRLAETPPAAPAEGE